jgi:hypothetical protein
VTLRGGLAATVCAALLVVAGVTDAEDVRLTLFETYNSARTYDDVKPLVSGALAQQYAAVASRDVRLIPDILTQQQLAAYRPRLVEIDGSNSFLVLENVRPMRGSDTSAQAYLLARNGAGRWTLANRMAPDSVIKSLWTRQFSPSNFNQPASCVIDGHEFSTQSALAVRRGATIEIRLYPFEFTQADLDYWRQMSGVPGAEIAAASHFNGRIPTICRVVVSINAAGRASFQNVGFDDQTGSLARSTLWQPPLTTVSRLVFEQDVIELETAGAVGADQTGFRWKVALKLPVWQQGL